MARAVTTSKLLRRLPFMRGTENEPPLATFSATRSMSSLPMTWKGGRSQARASASRQNHRMRRTAWARGESAEEPVMRQTVLSSRSLTSRAEAIMRSRDSKNQSSLPMLRRSLSRVSAISSRYLVSLMAYSSISCGRGRMAQLAFWEALDNSMPKYSFTSAARPNAVFPTRRAAIMVSKRSTGSKFPVRRSRRKS